MMRVSLVLNSGPDIIPRVKGLKHIVVAEASHSIWEVVSIT